MNSIGPNLWTSHDWEGAQPCVDLGGHRHTHWGARPSQSELVFTHKKALITDKSTPQFHQLSGWLISDDPTGEEAGCGGPRLAWLHVVCGCEAGWTYCQIL